MDYREEIQRYLPATEQEQAEKEAVLSLMESFPDSLLTRDNTVAHFTASAVTVSYTHLDVYKRQAPPF